MIDLAFDRIIYTLRLRRAARLHFHHGFLVHNLLTLGKEDPGRRNAVQTDSDPAGLRGVVGFDCEAGRVAFEPGDAFSVGVTLIGPSRALSGTIGDHLVRVGELGRSALGPFDVAGARHLPQPDLPAITRAIADASALRLRFLSPLRLARPVHEVRDGREWMDGDWFSSSHFLERLWSRLKKLETGVWPKDSDGRPPLPGQASALTADDLQGLFWLDVTRATKGADARRAHHRESRLDSLGGIVGEIALPALDPAWAALLAVGQFVHLGEQTHYGLGAWRVEPVPPFSDFHPAVSLLDRMARENNLTAARQHVADDAEDRGELDVGALATALRTGTYKTGPLYGFLHQKEGAKVRPLAVPSFRDRTAQRALVQVLTPAVDMLLEDCSWAYRKGLSRAGAARAIQQAYRDGFRFVLDADIESFFDSVDWDRIIAMIRAWFPLDPLEDLVRPWLTAPVIFEGRAIEREQGLPQGAPISPLLANLYLDVLDEKLLEDGFRLVRYADDFVVLCRTVEAAEAARTAAREALAGLELTLSEEKTAIRSLDDGLTYLGYLFCRSVVLDASHGEVPPPPQSVRGVPPRSWLASLPVEEIAELLLESGRAKKGRRAAAVPLMTAEPHGDRRQPLYILGPEVAVRLEQGALRLEAGEVKDRRIVKELSQVVFLGEPRGTLPMVAALARAGVPVFLCDHLGRVEAMCVPHPPDPRLWLAQTRFGEMEDARRSVVREIVGAKLRAYAAVARRLLDDARAGDELSALEREVWNKTEIASVRGVEGRAGAVWFASLKEALPEEWGFTGRKRHPPPDAVNAMLSLAYTVLYHHATTALLAEGLHPGVGIYHEQRAGLGWYPLAADLQEEVRHLADRVVLTVIRKSQVIRGQFDTTKEGRCVMDTPARRTVIEEMKKRLSVTFTPEEGVTLTWREGLVRQARQMKEVIMGLREHYVPLETPK